MYASMGFMAAKTVQVDGLTSPKKLLFKRQMTFIQYLRLCTRPTALAPAAGQG